MPAAKTTKAPPTAEVTTEAPAAPAQTAAPLPTGEVTPQAAPAAVMAAEIAQVQEPAAMPPQEPAPMAQAPAPQAPYVPQQSAQYAPQAGASQQYSEGPTLNNGSFPQPQVAPPAQVGNPNEPQPQSANGSVAENMGFVTREVTVDSVTPTAIPVGARTMDIRVNEDIENMSITSGGRPPRIYSFQRGHMYRVPLDVAAELDSIGKLWH